MSIPERLAACAGAWHGPNKLWISPDGPADECRISLRVNPILLGTFLRVDYAWEYGGKPQEGSLIVGGSEETANAYWIDTWHMGSVGMTCRGERVGDTGLSVRGSYAAPPGPDWGWRIDLLAEDPDGLRLVMYNITPEGQEELAVDAPCTRA